MDTVVRSKTAYDADYMNEQDFSDKSQINANVFVKIKMWRNLL
jgi:hypothetical protein